MSRSFKQQPFGCLRNPKGRIAALQNDVRPGAVPPSSWDDIQHDKQAYKQWNKIAGLKKNLSKSKRVIRTKSR